MNEVTTTNDYAPGRLLDSLRSWTNCTTDRMLARLLCISQRALRQIRTGKFPLQPSMLISMAECAGKSVDELRRVLGDRRARARMHTIAAASISLS